MSQPSRGSLLSAALFSDMFIRRVEGEMCAHTLHTFLHYESIYNTVCSAAHLRFGGMVTTLHTVRSVNTVTIITILLFIRIIILQQYYYHQAGPAGRQQVLYKSSTLLWYTCYITHSLPISLYTIHLASAVIQNYQFEKRYSI